jgi:tungstate transport system substrate-binding protein
MRVASILLACAVAFGVTSCGDRGDGTVVLATTTSVEDTGLLEQLIPAFQEAHPDIAVQATAVGTGQALELGRRGDADVLIVHSPVDEKRFIAEGHGLDRRPLMYNEFVLVGPPEDPADIAGMSDTGEAFQRIAQAEMNFVSRGDDSGTHRRERSVWSIVGVTPAGPWYIEAGLGMGDALRVASERRAYILSDIATYLTNRAAIDLEIVSQGDPRLVNQYSVMLVSRARNESGARAFIDWITGQQAAAIIEGIATDPFGSPVFRSGTAPVGTATTH